jgi:hypothetical protein
MLTVQSSTRPADTCALAADQSSVAERDPASGPARDRIADSARVVVALDAPCTDPEVVGMCGELGFCQCKRSLPVLWGWAGQLYCRRWWCRRGDGAVGAAG